MKKVIRSRLRLKPASIAHLRKDVFRLSQADFAALLGASSQTISRWERGLCMPSGIAAIVIEACWSAVHNYGEARIRGVNWTSLLAQSGILKTLAGLLNFATTKPDAPVHDMSTEDDWEPFDLAVDEDAEDDEDDEEEEEDEEDEGGQEDEEDEEGEG